MQRRTFVRSGLTAGTAMVLASPLSLGRVLAVVAQEGEFPEGPLGDAAKWILDVANAGPGKLKVNQIEGHFDISFFETTSMPEIYGLLSDLQSNGVTYTIDFDTFATTADLPATNGNFVMIGDDGSQLAVSIQINRESGLISGLSIESVDAETGEEEPGAFPEGPLGDAAKWILDVANAGPGKLKVNQIEGHFDISFFETTSMPEIYGLLSDLQSNGVTYAIDFDTFLTTMDLPATNGRFVMIGDDGSQLAVSIQINRESGLISGLSIDSLDAETGEEEPGEYPEGPLGDAAKWILDVANAGPGKLKVSQIEGHFDISFFETMSMPEIYGLLSDLQSNGVTYTIDFDTFLTTMDLPATNGRFVMIGDDGTEIEVSLQVDRDSGLITGFAISPVSGDATPEVS